MGSGRNSMFVLPPLLSTILYNFTEKHLCGFRSEPATCSGLKTFKVCVNGLP